MPELPEVETIRRDLGSVLRGQQIVSLRVKRPKLLRGSRRDFTRYLVGARVMAVSRRAKQLALELSSGYVLLIHLKMTGQLVWARKARFARHELNARHKLGRLPRGGRSPLYVVGGHPIAGVTGVPNRYTYITLSFRGGSKLYFNDVRQFGYWKLVPRGELTQVFAALGPEPLTQEFTLERFTVELKRRPRTSIKAALLDQSVVAGIGNIYADETLFVAKVKPSRKVRTLNRAEVKQLYQSIKRVLRRAVKARGTSFNSYVDGLGRAGTYWAKRLVYGRAGLPCPRCGQLLQKAVVAGRGTTWCPHCQR